MSYHTFRTELTGAAAQDYMSTLAVDSVNDEIVRLHGLRVGISDTVMYPNKAKMDRYVLARAEYLNNLAPMVNVSTGQTVRHWEWRSQLTVTSGPISARATGTVQLCAKEIYGNLNDRSSTLSNWTLEKWNKVSKRTPTSQYYYLCAYYTDDKETYSDISDATISDAGLGSVFTVAELQLAAGDWYKGMNWIHATNDYNKAGEDHYNAYASHGINYLITASKTGLYALDSRRQHYTDLVSLCARYYTI